MLNTNGIRDRAEIPGYQLLELVGEGSNGFVVKARQLATERTVAIKFLKPDLSDQEQRGKQRLLGEAKLLSAICHRNVIQVLGAGIGTESPYVITEFVDGILHAFSVVAHCFGHIGRVNREREIPTA